MCFLLCKIFHKEPKYKLRPHSALQANMNDIPRERQRAYELAKDILSSDVDYLDKIIEMSQIGNSIYESVWGTEFHIFGIIESDTDHLPTKAVREHCSKEWLAKADQEISECIVFYRKKVTEACAEILSKHGGV